MVSDNTWLPWPRRAVVTGLLMVGILSWLSGGVQAASLAEILAVVYSNNPEIEAARAELRALDEGIPQARSEWLPRIDGNVSWGFSQGESNFYSQRNDRSTNPSSYSLRGVQPIYSGGSTIAKMGRSRAQVEAGRYNLINVEQRIFLRAISAYLALLRDQKTLELARSNEKILELRLQVTRDELSVGEVTLTDLSQSQARLAAATAERIGQEGTVHASSARYVAVVGASPQLLVMPETPPLPRSMEAAIERGIRTHPQVRSSEAQTKAATRYIDELTGGFSPSINIEGKLTQSFEQVTPQDSSYKAEIIAQIKVPLYQAGLISSRVREAKQRKYQRRRQSDQVRRQVRQQVDVSWQKLKAFAAQQRSFHAQIKANTVALEGVREEALVGTRTTLDILNAENELFQSQVSLVRANHDYMIAAFSLLAAIGGLNIDTLDIDVTPYDPTGYANAVEWKIWGTDTDNQRGTESDTITRR